MDYGIIVGVRQLNQCLKFRENHGLDPFGVGLVHRLAVPCPCYALRHQSNR